MLLQVVLTGSMRVCYTQRTQRYYNYVVCDMGRGLEMRKSRDVFKTAKERYGVWPTTVWECDMSNKTTRELKHTIGDICSARQGAGTLGYQSRTRQTRKGCFSDAADDKSIYRGKITESIFNPAVASWLLNCYGPKTGLCFDPFAGGGTRAIMAAKHGMSYLGTEIRQEEVDATRERIQQCGVDHLAEIRRGDACVCDGIPDACADFLITCPPYWNLETYNGGRDDLSMIRSYDEFIEQLRKAVQQTFRVLKPRTTSCWVVGLHRDDDGKLTPIHHDVVRLHIDAGFQLHEEIVLYQKNNSAILRVGQFDKGQHFLVRVHEYALIFKKPKLARLGRRRKLLKRRRK